MFDVVASVKTIEKEIINWRRELHQIPELGLELPKTSSYIQKQLDEIGVHYTTLLEGNAIVALIEGEKGTGSTIGIRADMDGLPIKEETGLMFSSTNGNMHACGHDSHSAILLGVGKILSENKDKFKGNVKLLFQPGEEYPGGAKPMIEQGALDNPKVDAIIGLHSGQLSPEVTHGSIGISYGDMMASMDRFYINVKGKGGHGAYPETCIDPIVIASEIVSSLQKIISREISSQESAVLSICRINGGFNQNIIPDNVELEGTVRTFENRIRENIAKRIEAIVKGTTLMNGGDYDYEYDFKYPSVRNDADFTRKFVESAGKIMDQDSIIEIEKPLMGGEDFSFYLEELPGTFIFLSNMQEVDGKIYGHHNSKFDLDEGQFYLGASLLIQAAIDYLND